MDVLWGYVILIDAPKIKKKDEKTMKKVVDEWSTEKAVMGKLFDVLSTYDNERDMTEKTALKLKKHLENSDRLLDDATVGNSSKMCVGVS